jgi:hypothetical protein
VLTSNIMERRRRDVVGLPFAHQAVVVQDVLLLGVIEVGLGLEDPLGLASGTKLAW